jgi:hypothetical protein
MAREHADTALGGYDVCASSAVAVNCGTLQSVYKRAHHHRKIPSRMFLQIRDLAVPTVVFGLKHGHQNAVESDARQCASFGQDPTSQATRS